MTAIVNDRKRGCYGGGRIFTVLFIIRNLNYKEFLMFKKNPSYYTKLWKLNLKKGKTYFIQYVSGGRGRSFGKAFPFHI